MYLSRTLSKHLLHSCVSLFLMFENEEDKTYKHVKKEKHLFVENKIKAYLIFLPRNKTKIANFSIKKYEKQNLAKYSTLKTSDWRKL